MWNTGCGFLQHGSYIAITHTHMQADVLYSCLRGRWCCEIDSGVVRVRVRLGLGLVGVFFEVKGRLGPIFVL